MFKKSLLILCLATINTYTDQGVDKIPLASEKVHKIGMQVWQNSGRGDVNNLVVWNKDQKFPYLGIGHCIWYPEGHKGPFTEVFPNLCNYLKENKIVLPKWLDKARHTGAPWKDREEFLKNTERREELQKFLVSTTHLQAAFMVERFNEHIPLMFEQTPPWEREQLAQRLKLMQSTPLGTYALVDYLNFKGNGLNPQEVSKGQRWGLLQVLKNMPKDVNKDNVNQVFAISAAQTLLDRIKNSGPEYNLAQYLLGWVKRINTYRDATLFLTS